MRGPEGKIQDKVLKFARDYGLLYKKQEVGRFLVDPGWLDVQFFPDLKKEGPPFFIEFKAPGKELSDLQRHKKKALNELGYECYMIDSAAHGVILLKQKFKRRWQ